MEKDNVLAPSPAKIVKTESMTDIEKLIEIHYPPVGINILSVYD